MKQEKPLPDLKQQVIHLLNTSDKPLTKNQLAKALGLKADARVELKAILCDLKEAGKVNRGSRRRLVAKTSKKDKDLIVAEVTSVDEDGELYATPLEASDEPPLLIHLKELRPSYREGRSALGIGARVVIKLIRQTADQWQGTVIKRLEKERRSHIGIFNINNRGGHLSSLNRKDSFSGVHLTVAQAQGLKPGEVIEYTLSHTHEFKVIKKLGQFDDPHIFSEIAIHAHGIPHIFSKEAIADAEAGAIPPLGNRHDYRNVPLVTIDGEDARDFDDAVWAEADTDPRNEGGWRLLVAIADVSYYVRQHTALDREAHQRGNSVYFPDRVVPMLPEALSNNLCSLRPDEDRACLVAEMIINSNGKLKSHRIKRGLMRSKARLTYNQVQNALDGKPDAQCAPLLESILRPLYGAYQSLAKARAHRGTLELEIPERQIIFDDNKRIAEVKIRERLESHKLIEEFMIAANVAAAKTLLAKNWPCMYRVHDTPDVTRVENLRRLLKQMKLAFAKAMKPTPQHFNELLQQVQQHRFERMINQLILRSQAQARYSPDNIGHFGLSLSHYAHFTSPIRRYSDLVVHRSLIGALGLGDDGYLEKPADLTAVGDHISKTERTAAAAEREVSERLAIAYVTPMVGEIMETVIVGVNHAGLFVEMPNTGAEGFIPKSSLNDYFQYEENSYRLIGRRNKTAYQLGQTILTRLVEADVLTNSLSFRIIEDNSKRAERNTERKSKDKKKGKKSFTAPAATAPAKVQDKPMKLKFKKKK